MIQYSVYPGGKKGAVTFSYDDGPENDKRLIDLFDKYGVKSTFHLNGWKYAGMDERGLAGIREIYKNHEISCHTLSHGFPTDMPSQSLVYEIMKDREILEKIAGYPVVGMSYPFGSYNSFTAPVFDACGIVYSRTTVSTRGFYIPEKFIEWHPTCHHKDAGALLDNFERQMNTSWSFPLFYIWGHSYEFRTEEDWAYMENVVSALAGRDNIWYATNIEIYDYVLAQRSLRISADEKTFYNPTAIDVWVKKDKDIIIHIPAGKTVKI